MDENTLQWVIDHMSKDEYAKYKQDIAEAERRGERRGEKRGEKKGEKKGAERMLAKMLAQGLVSREAAISILGTDEAGLERLLAEYRSDLPEGES